MAPVSPSPVLTAPCLLSQEGPFRGQGRHLQAGHRADEDLDLPADKLQDGGRERGESSPESVRTPPRDSTWDGADIVSPPGHPRVLPQHRLQPRGDAGGGDLSQIRVPVHPGDDGQQL